MRKYILYSIVLIILSLIIGIVLYSSLPDRLATHWNAQGEVDGYMSKFWGLFFLPLLLIILFPLLYFLPKIDPMRKDMEGFRDKYDFLVGIIFSFMFYIYLLSIVWNLGYKFNMVVYLLPALALLFFCIGIILKSSKRNWFMGIRNPWTMSSDYVWERTHTLASNLFKISSGIMLFGFIFPNIAILLIIIPLLVVILLTMIYSYNLYKKEQKNQKNQEKYNKPNEIKNKKHNKNEVKKNKSKINSK